MKLRLMLSVLALGLLCACGETPAPSPSPPPEPGPSAPAPQAAQAPQASGEPGFTVLPVTEAGIRTLYGWEGYEVTEIVPYEGDYLVEYGYPGGDDFTLLGWVFGETGRRVQLTAMTQFLSYEITGPGQVAYTGSGVDAGTPWKGMPELCEVRVLGDRDGQIVQAYAETVETRSTPWLDPAQPFAMGFWDDGALAPGERYEQLYDARIDADGLSFSFIPSGESVQRFQSFFPASTTIPCFDTSLDPDTGRFTLRFYNTCLESGGITAEDGAWAGQGYPAYPYAFPAGSLGRDSHFLTDAEIRQEGENTVLTCALTDMAFRFTVETSNLGGDNIPALRIVFRERIRIWMEGTKPNLLPSYPSPAGLLRPARN